MVTVSANKAALRTRQLLAFVPLAMLLLGSGCVAPVVSLRQGPRQYVATDYDAVLARWTRAQSLVLVDELETALTVNATFESWDFRWAYVIRYARDYRLTIVERQRLLREQLNETRRSHQFFVALYGSHYKESNLTKKNSAWVVRLIDARGNETPPMQIEAIKKSSVLERRYFPYNTVWRQAFRITFPIETPDGRPTLSPQAEWLGLRFAGAYGNTDLIWDLAPAAASNAQANTAAPRVNPARLGRAQLTQVKPVHLARGGAAL